MEYGEAVAWLYGQQWHGIKLGLENIRRLLEALRVPLAGPGTPQFLHVAGTNGKGSVCAMLEAILWAAGYRTGLFTSPHLVSFRERIRVDGEMISELEAAAGLTEIRRVARDWNPAPTFFEITTALALRYFAERGVQLAVLETGLGGRLDATNVVTPRVSVITPIDLDHQQYLGDSVAAIALEKAGIIKDGVPVVSAPQMDDAQTVLTQIASHRGSPFHLVTTPLEGLQLGLAGSHQQWNAALAVHALDVAEIEVPEGAIARGLENVHWPGRFQLLEERLILDGAHNPAAARRLARTWRECFGAEKAVLLLAGMRDKDIAGICQELGPITERVVVTSVPNERALRPEEFREIVTHALPAIPCEIAAEVEPAIAQALATGGRVLATGSLFLVGEILRLRQGGGDNLPSTQ